MAQLIKDVARDNAADVLADHWDGQFPVDPFSIADKMGITVWDASLDHHISGVLLKHDDQAAQIYINRDEPAARQRFTCAHELGHFVDRRRHEDDSYSFEDHRDDEPNTPIEFYADWFAANLLMPRVQFREKLDAGYADSDLMGYFGVSRAAVQARKKNIDL
jgi:Zn-dependent peptidase ImmA (M78 family)